MQLLLKKRSAAFPRRQPSSGFGEICYVHPERAHICRCINFTTIPRRIQDKCITFILLFYFLQRNPCNCSMPHCEHFWHICWCYAGYTHLRCSTQHASVRAESVEKIFRRIRPFFQTFCRFLSNLCRISDEISNLRT